MPIKYEIRLNKFQKKIILYENVLILSIRVIVYKLKTCRIKGGHIIIKFLGFVNVTLLFLLLSPFILRRINKHFYNNKNNTLKKTIATLSKAHMYFGFILLISALVHGYMALGELRLHSGVILWFWVLMQVILGNIAKKTKKPYLFKVHRTIGVLTLVFLILHLIQVN